MAATTASAEQSYAKNQLFAINATGDINISFGNVGNVPTPDNTCWMIPYGVIAQFDLGDWQSAFKVYNPGNAAIDVYWLELKRN